MGSTMVKFLLGLATGVILVFLTIFLLFFTLLRFREKPPEIADNSVLVLRLSGELPEKPPVELPDFLSNGPAPVTITSYLALAGSRRRGPAHQAPWCCSRRAIGGMGEDAGSPHGSSRSSASPASRSSPTCASRARANTIWRAPPTAFISAPRNRSCSKGCAPRSCISRRRWTRSACSVEVEHAGKYKDFGDMFTRTDMSPETREVMTSWWTLCTATWWTASRRAARRQRRGDARHHRPGPVHGAAGAEGGAGG